MSKPPNTGSLLSFLQGFIYFKTKGDNSREVYTQHTKLSVTAILAGLVGRTSTAPISHQMTAALTNDLTATLSDVMRPNYPAKSLTFRNYSK
jgi:hypothetical protein